MKTILNIPRRTTSRLHSSPVYVCNHRLNTILVFSKILILQVQVISMIWFNAEVPRERTSEVRYILKIVFILQLLSFCSYRDIQISFLFMARIFRKDEKLIILQYYNLKDWQVTFFTLSIHAQFYASMIFKENFVNINCI